MNQAIFDYYSKGGNTPITAGAGRTKKYALIARGNTRDEDIRVGRNDLAPIQFPVKSINKEERATRKRKRPHKRRKNPDIFDKKPRR